MRQTPDPFLPTRQSLLSRRRRWDDHAGWQEFFDTYWKLIYAFARQAGLSDAEAQDVVQETILSVAKKMPEFKYDPKVCSFKGWLRHVTEKRIVDGLRKRSREALAETTPGEASAEDEAAAEPGGATESELEAVWDAEWEKNLLAAALERLQMQVSSKQFQIFHRHVIEERPAREVCATLGVSLAQVYLAKHRLSRLLKGILQRIKDKPL